MISFFKEKVELPTKEDVVKLHLIIKTFENNLSLSKADIDTLYELYTIGYSEDFYKNCIDKGYFKTKQTVRNSITRMTNAGILKYKKRGERYISEKYIPTEINDKIIFQYLVGNLNGN